MRHHAHDMFNSGGIGFGNDFFRGRGASSSDKPAAAIDDGSENEGEEAADRGKKRATPRALATFGLEDSEDEEPETVGAKKKSKKKVNVSDAKVAMCTKVSDAITAHKQVFEKIVQEAKKELEAEANYQPTPGPTHDADGKSTSTEELTRKLKRDCLERSLFLVEVWIEKRTDVPSAEVTQIFGLGLGRFSM